MTGWTPDVGHIINGGMDPLAKMKEYESLINLVHYKDWDGNPSFTLMGEGKVNFQSITQCCMTKTTMAGSSVRTKHLKPLKTLTRSPFTTASGSKKLYYLLSSARHHGHAQDG